MDVARRENQWEISETCLQSGLHFDVCDFERGMEISQASIFLICKLPWKLLKDFDVCDFERGKEISQGIHFPDLQSAMKTSQGYWGIKWDNFLGKQYFYHMSEST